MHSLADELASVLRRYLRLKYAKEEGLPETFILDIQRGFEESLDALVVRFPSSGRHIDNRDVLGVLVQGMVSGEAPVLN